MESELAFSVKACFTLALGTSKQLKLPQPFFNHLGTVILFLG